MVCFVDPAALSQFTVVSTQAHGAAHVLHCLLLLHEVDDGVLGVCRHLAAVGILIAQYITCKLNDHHLHAEADAKGREVMCTSIFGSNYFTLSTALPEARTDDDARHVA